MFGPGLVVMLADSDVGSVITAGQSGVQWGYRLLGLQFLLMPILYIVQELTVRLGIFTGRGYGELIRATFGPFWAWLSVAGLAIATIGALLTEFSGVAGVGELYGLPRIVTLPVAAIGLLAVVITGSYRRGTRGHRHRAVRAGVLFRRLGRAAQTCTSCSVAVWTSPFGDRDYLYLSAANIGSVVMPWMLFYQQSAIADKKLAAGTLRDSTMRHGHRRGGHPARDGRGPDRLRRHAERQRHHAHTVGDMSEALTPYLGIGPGRLVFSAGVLGAGMVAAIVCSLGFAWGLGEVSGYRHALEQHPLRVRGSMALIF